MLKLYYFFVGMKSRKTYWSLSPFAVWCTHVFGGIQKPQAATLEEFDEIDRVNKQKNPGLYWFIDTFLNNLQDFIYFFPDTYSNYRYKFINAFINKTHVISTGLKIGDYHDIDSRILEGLFKTVIDFVEVEKAGAHRRYHKSIGYISNRAAGLAHLNWEISLNSDQNTQSATAAELKEIYLWILDERPFRLDVYEASGWNAYYSNLKETGVEKDPEVSSKLFKTKLLIEQQYDEEDTQMLIRIVKLRNEIWT